MKDTLKGRFDSIIFDLDGTLWDATTSVAHAWQSAKEQVDFVEVDITPADVAGIAGLPYDAIYDKLFPELSYEERAEFKEICAKKELEVLAEKGGVLYPELEETLQYLSASYQLFIVSNCQRGYIELFLEKYNLEEYFIGHRCYGTSNLPKADNIKAVVDEYELKAPVYVGDTIWDFEFSEKAGVPFIYAGFGFGKVGEGAIAEIHKFSELSRIL